MEQQELEERIKQIQTYLETIDEQLVALRELKKVIEDFSKLKSGDELLVPLANGIFVNATLGKSKDLLMNVGSNAVVPRQPDKALEMLSTQETALVQYRSDMLSSIEQAWNQLGKKDV